MTQPNQSTSNSDDHEAQNVQQRDSIAGLLGIDANSVEILELAKAHGRYIYAWTVDGDKLGFVKADLRGDPFARSLLERESAATQTLYDLGLPVPAVLSPFSVSASGQSALQTERILPDAAGTHFTSTEQAADADSALGRLVADAMLHMGGIPLPNTVATEFLVRNDPRNMSLASAVATWKRDLDIVFDPQYAGTLGELVDPTWLLETVAADCAVLARLLEASENSGGEYFVHNDAGLTNMIFQEFYSWPYVLLDFENAGAVHNQQLARLTDWSSMYGRMWANQTMQQIYLATLWESATPEQGPSMHAFLRGVVVVGTLSLSTYGMPKEHGGHPTARALLGNLGANLLFLDQLRNSGN